MKQFFEIKPPCVPGERLVVSGYLNLEARVSSIAYLANESRWAILLDWGSLGKSTVYDVDEGKTWYRYSSVN